MKKRTTRDPDGKVTSEGLVGRPVPRAGLKNQTGGKGKGSADVRRKPANTVSFGPRRGS